jgi:hypothetical protein
MNKQDQLKLKALKEDAFRSYVAAPNRRVWVAGNACDSKNDIARDLVSNVKFLVSLSKMSWKAVSGEKENTMMDKALKVLDAIETGNEDVLDNMLEA